MKILLYYHAGSKNHGCEAIVRTLREMFREDELILYTFDRMADCEFGLDKILTVKQCASKKNHYTVLERILIHLHLYQEGQECYGEMLQEEGIDWAFAIGGDNYCYQGQPEELAYINRQFKKRNVKTALVGCSIDEDVVKRRSVQNDLRRYDAIFARESLTYEMLKNRGITNVTLLPDSAFLLGIKRENAISVAEDREYIGINVSPLIIKNESKKNIVYENYIKLIQYILEETQYHILLIPHVCVEWDNDEDVLLKLYEDFHENDRMTLLPERGCEELKYYISKCKFVICARTHVSIAAYSLKVPTLVIGYSVKSRGIATDLFGNCHEYVIPVEKITSEDIVLTYFLNLLSKKEHIRNILENKVENFKCDLVQVRKIILNE